jgi:multiple sugar transport system substrate-binding protein
MKGTTRRGLFQRAGQAAASTGAVAALASAATAAPAVAAPANLTGQLQVVLNLDFNKNYNTFLKDTITKYAADKKWALDLSDLAGFTGSSDIWQKLQAQKQAGQPVDLIIHTLSGLLMQTYDLARDAASLVNAQVAKYGQVYPSFRAGYNLGGKWVALPFHDRTGGYWVRRDKFAAVGKSVANGDFDNWEAVKASCQAVSDPANNFYGWGMTANRSGDGETMVWNIIWEWGGALVDPTGQLVTLYSPETIDGMTWLADIYQNPANANMLPPGVGSWTDPSNNEAWLAGTIGFTSNAGTLYAQSVVDNTTLTDGTVIKDVTDFTLIPLGPYGVRLQGSGGTHFFFMNGSKNYDEAATLAQDLINPEIQRNLWRIGEGYTVPAYVNLWNDPVVMANPVNMQFKPVSLNEPPFTGTAYRGPISAAADAVSQENVATDMFGAILGGKPVDQAVREAHQQCVDIFKQFGLRGA